MRDLRLMEKLTLGVGITGIGFNLLGLTLSVRGFNYAAVFLGRIAGFLFLLCVDRFQPWYLTPITLSTLNLVFQKEEILFLEYMSQSMMYQWTAYKTFVKITAGEK